jgi:hypothetical protein
LKICDTLLQTESSGVQQTTQFSIAASRKAFEILSSGLYTNKFHAIMRELSCNAVDAHNAAGKPTLPFEIHLPNNSEPYLSFRDFGAGLSPERMLDVYIRYFVSDKTDSNDYIGAFGLGAKSPLSYVDSFQVVSRHEGKRRTYFVSKSVDGIPELSLVEEADDPDTPSGVEVQIPVQRGDFYSFENAAKEILPHFEVHPRIAGKWDFALTRPEYDVQTPSCGVVKKRHSGSWVKLVMGGVAYPVDIKAVSDDNKAHPKIVGVKDQKFVMPAVFDPSADRYSYLGWHITLFAAIGDVEVNASREGLSYTPNTITNVRRLIEKARDEVVEHVYNKIGGTPTLWDARVEMAKLDDYSAWLSKGKPVTWQGRPVEPKLQFNDGSKPYHLKNAAGQAVLEGVYMVGALDGKLPSTRSDVGYKWRDSTCDPFTASTWFKAVFVDDLNGKPGKFARSRRYIEENHGSGCGGLLIPEELATKAFLDACGFAHLVVKCSACPEAQEVVAAPRQKRERVKLRSVSEYNSWVNHKDVDPSAGGVFIECCRFKVYDEQNKDTRKLRSIEELRDVYHAIEALSGTSLLLYTVRTADREGLVKKGPWVSFDAYARKLVQDHSKKMLRDLSLRMAYLEADNPDYHHKATLASRRQGSAFVAAAELFKQAEAANKNKALTAFELLAKRYELPNTIPKPAQDLLQADKVARQLYPLLTKSNRWVDIKPHEFDVYIDLVDAQQGNKVKAAKPRKKKAALVLAHGAA